MKKLDKAVFINPGCWPVFIGFVNTEKAHKRLMKHLNIGEDNPFTDCGSCSTYENLSNGDITIVISLNAKKLKTRTSIYEALAHEASHACDDIIDHIKDREPSTEMRAYIVGWLVREGAKAFKL